MKKGITKYLQYTVVLVVVVILLCGIFSILRRLTGTSSINNLSARSFDQQSEKNIDEEADNSVPITDLSVSVPATNIRVGETMQLDVSYEPKNATNTKLKWSCSEEGLVSISEDGVLTPAKDSAKHTVEVTATTTDGSNLSTTFELRIYPEIDPSKPMVAITMDDGPYPDTTNKILDVFEENYAKATFFCLGENAGYYPEVVQREYELGMEVGTHTQSHKQLTKLSGSELTEEIQKSVDAIKNATGVAPTLIRPSYGAINSEVLAEAKKQGLCVVNWSLDTEDWKNKNADATYKMVMTATDGDVVLLHDIHEYNINAVERFVPDLIAEGYQLVTISEMYAARGETLDSGTIHYRTDPTTEAVEQTTAAGDEDGAEAGTAGDDATGDTTDDTAGSTTAEDTSAGTTTSGSSGTTAGTQ